MSVRFPYLKCCPSPALFYMMVLIHSLANHIKRTLIQRGPVGFLKKLKVGGAGRSHLPDNRKREKRQDVGGAGC